MGSKIDEYVFVIPGGPSLSLTAGSVPKDLKNKTPTGRPDPAELEAAMLDPYYVKNTYTKQEAFDIAMKYLWMPVVYHTPEFFNYVMQCVKRSQYLADYFNLYRLFDGRLRDAMSKTNDTFNPSDGAPSRMELYRASVIDDPFGFTY